jgi:formate-dependent nitrite reductase membrane component NrfD
VPVKPVTAAHGLLGLALGAYTGTLIAVTAVPLWSAAGWLMGPLFLSTGLASGAAALRLPSRVTGTTITSADDEVDDVEQIATLAALGIVAARELLAPPRVSAALRGGLWGTIFKFGALEVFRLSCGVVVPCKGLRVKGIQGHPGIYKSVRGELQKRARKPLVFSQGMNGSSS